jgi:hypothetical protein
MHVEVEVEVDIPTNHRFLRKALIYKRNIPINNSKQHVHSF